jgi:sulfur relay (sulfurtransferase) complex TusBCD TusD component (DsrE family)
MPERNNPISATRTGRRSKLLRLIQCLGTALSIAMLAASAQGQSSITLAWNPGAGNAIAGYRLHDGVASRTYTNVIATGNATSNTISGLAGGATYYFAVTAVGTNGLESGYSAEVSYTVPLPTNNPPTIALSSPANGRAYPAPASIPLAANVTANGHTITRVQFYNGATLLGTVAASPYSFSWNSVSAGTYSLSAKAVYDSGTTVVCTSANVTVTNAPTPSIVLSFPANGASYVTPATIPLAASVAANGHTITQVQFYNGATLLGTVAAAPYSFSWNSVSAGTYSLSAKAVYDSGNVTCVNATSVATIWPATAVPGTVDGGPDSAVELGVKFRSDVAGNVTGIRFYKATANTGTHLGHLWSNTGTLLASATFAGESASGWQQVNFATPVALAANTVYVASYHCTVGHYSEDLSYFTSKGVDNPPLHALTNGVSGGNSVYAYGASSAFPNQTWNAANYWVDVVFSRGTTLPAPWQTVDIGNVGLAGSAYPSGSLWSVTGAGTLSGTADAFRFLYQPMSADGEIRAQLSSVPNTSTNARVGVMIRETLAPGSRSAFMGISPGGTFRSQSRSGTSGSTASTACRPTSGHASCAPVIASIATNQPPAPTGRS